MLAKSEHVCVRENVCLLQSLTHSEGQRFQSPGTTYGAKLNNLEAFAVEKLNKHVLFCGTTLVLCLKSIHVKSSASICISQILNLMMLSEEKLTTQQQF